VDDERSGQANRGDEVTVRGSGFRRTGLILLILAIAFGASGWVLYLRIMRPVVPIFASDEEHFKYGSIGNDGATGIPYPIWVVLPEVCAKYLPGNDGYAALGFLWEPGRDRAVDPPVGFSKARVGVERMAINCAFCHTTRARLSTDAEPNVYVGGAGNTIDIQGYQRFLSDCAMDKRFKAEHLIPVMDEMVGLSAFEKLLYRFVPIPFVRQQLTKQGEAFAWTWQRPRWGPGRVDPFNPAKFMMLSLADDGTVGNSDMLPLWNVGAREHGKSPPIYHWDGLSTSLRDAVVSSALGDGMVAREYRPASMTRLENYLRELKAPPSPHKPNEAAVNDGKKLFDEHCSKCHAHDGALAGTLIPSREVGTDIQRINMWTEAASQAYANYRVGHDWNLTGFRKQDGYLASTLDGLWLNGPYLHNGSVPSLRALLEKPEKRPRAFVRGSDVVDSQNGGFISPECDPNDPPKQGFCYDTSQIGNSNAGHIYGTTLSQQEKEALLAYLLTL
jgi:mono/diheme cytochrome c family protein